MPSFEGIPSKKDDFSTATTVIQALLPNVFVTPPEEEYDMPPWCCFDADKDALPGALPDEDIIAADYDYTAHGEDDDEIEDAEDAEDISVLSYVTEGDAPRNNVYVMHSLVAEAEGIRERLKSLDLSVRSRPSSMETEDVPTDAVPYEEDTMDTTTPAPEPEQPQAPRKFFSFKPMLRKKSRKELVSFEQQESPVSTADIPLPRQSIDKGEEFSVLERPNSHNSILPDTSAGRKPGFFARLRRISTKKADARPIPQLKSSEALRSCETLTSSRSTQDAEPAMRRRFSFFELPRRPSVSSQSTIPTIPATPTILPDIELSYSTSSLATSSVPPTPEVVNTVLATSSPTDPMLETRKKVSLDAPSDIISPMADSVENLAASLYLPSYNASLPSSFSLNPLHFESLQFSSDDFP